MNNKIIISILLCLFVCTAVFGADATEPQFVEAQIMNVPFYYGGGVIDRSYPLLAYDGHAYIAIADMANAMDKMASYGVNINDEIINFSIEQISKNDWPISEELAFAIGKTIINETYSEFVNDSTEYAAILIRSSPLALGTQYIVRVKFDTKSGSILDENGNYIGGNNDVDVLIDPDTGAFMIQETYSFKHRND